MRSESITWTTPPLNVRSCGEVSCLGLFAHSSLETYCLRQCTSASLPTDKDDHISSLLHVLHSLSSSNITVCRARQQCWNEFWCSRNQLCSSSSALQDMVFKDVCNNIFVVILKRVVELCVWDLVEGIIVGSENLCRGRWSALNWFGKDSFEFRN